MFQTKQKAEIELNFFEYSNTKRYLASPDIVEYNKFNKPPYDIILDGHEVRQFHIFGCNEIKLFPKYSQTLLY